MIKAFQSAFQRYAEFSGRSTRSEYWYFALANFLILMAMRVFAVVFLMGGAGVFGGIWVLATIGYVIAAFIPSLSVLVRRLHDTGHSGWWYFIQVIPIIGFIWMLVLLCRDSTPGENRYGMNPKSPVGVAPGVAVS